MPLRVSGRNISIGAALQRKITDRVEEAASKYFRGGYSGHATVGKDGFGFRTECVLHLDSAHCSKPRAWPRMPMTAPNRPRSASKSGCDATNGAARTIRPGAAAARTPKMPENRQLQG